MPKTQPDDGEPKPSVNHLVGDQVLRSLGRPADLLRVSVHPMGDDRYRVNVYTGKDFTTGRIANSFFLTADEKGAIVSSSPEIAKLY